MRRRLVKQVLSLWFCFALIPFAESFLNANLYDIDSTTMWNGIPQEVNREAIGPPTIFKVGVDCDADYETIGEAMKIARSGDTLQLCAGVFDETVTIFNMKLAIIGQGRGKTILRAPFNTRYMINAGPNSNITVSRLSLDGNNNMAHYVPTPDNSQVFIAGVLCYGCDALIRAVSIFNIDSHQDAKTKSPSFGVFARSMSPVEHMVEVTNVNITGVTSSGIVLDGRAMTGLVRRNTLVGTGRMSYPASGIRVTRQATAIVKKNDVSNFKSAIPWLFQLSGISTSCPGYKTAIRHNVVHDNDMGITLVSSSEVQVRYNQVYAHAIGVSVEVQDMSRSKCLTPFSSSRNRISRNAIQDSSEHGLQFRSKIGAQGKINKNKVFRNSIKYSDKFHIAMFDGRQDSFTDNKFLKAGNSSIYVAGGDLGYFENNVMYESTSSGLLIANTGDRIPRNFTFVKNFISLSGEYGIFLQGGDSCLFDSNTIQFSGTEAIYEEEGTNNMFVNNNAW